MSGKDVAKAINRKIIDHQDRKYREVTAPAGLTASINKARDENKHKPMTKRL